jgi:hypothetical protein
MEHIMNAPRNTTTLDNSPIPVRALLAAAWTSFVLLYVYVDLLGFYQPGVIDGIRAGVVWEFDITQVWAITALAIVAVPILMVVLSALLPARVSRVVNLAVAAAYVVISAANALGEAWTVYYAIAIGLELIVLAVILRSAWTWPRLAR